MGWLGWLRQLHDQLERLRGQSENGYASRSRGRSSCKCPIPAYCSLLSHFRQDYLGWTTPASTS
eukprot:2502919-Prorocentrum_lima.AAC.1